MPSQAFKIAALQAEQIALQIGGQHRGSLVNISGIHSRSPNIVFMKLWLDVKHSTLNHYLLLWLIEADVFQMPQLHKHFNVGESCKRQISVVKENFDKHYSSLLKSR